LTPAAQLLAEHAERILSLVDVAEAELEGHRGSVTGRMCIAGFPSAARGIVTPALAELRRRHPRLDLKLAELEPDRSLPGVLRGDVDVAVIQDWFNRPLTLPTGLRRAELLEDVAEVALPATHRLAARTTVDLEQLAHDDWVSWPAGSGCHDWLQHTLHGYGVAPKIIHTAEEHATQLALVAGGFGVAVMPKLGRDTLPHGVRMVAVSPTLTRHVYAVWRSEADRRPAVGAAVRALAAVASGAQGTSTSLPIEPPPSSAA